MDGIVGMRQLRVDLAALIDRAADGEAITVTRDGVPVAAIVPIYLLDKLEQWEDEQLVRSAAAAEQEPGERISLTEMMAEVLAEPRRGST